MSKRFYEIFSRVNKIKLNEDVTLPNTDEYRDELEGQIKIYTDHVENSLRREGKIPQSISFGNDGNVELIEDDAVEYEGTNQESTQPQIEYSVTYRGKYNNIPLELVYRIIVVPEAKFISGGYTFENEYFVDDIDINF